MNYKQIISAYVYALSPTQNRDFLRLNNSSAFCESQVRAAPFPLRQGLIFLLWASAMTITRFGLNPLCTLNSLQIKERLNHLRAMKPFADLLKFIESFTYFSHYDPIGFTYKARSHSPSKTPQLVKNLIVGSGPGGATTGRLLTQKGEDTLILEEGRRFQDNEVQSYSVNEMVAKYRSQGVTVALGQERLNFVEGRAVGGGSEVNAGLFHKLPESILADWNQKHQLKLSIDELDFKGLESALRVRTSNENHPAGLKMQKGAQLLNWSSITVPRWIDERTSEPTRFSMSKTYLPQFENQGGRIVEDARAIRIRRHSGKWEVLYRQNSGKIQSVTTERLFLSSGAVQTPHLLQKSGFGKFGKRLQFHPSVKVMALFNEPVENPGIASEQVKEFSPRFSFGCSVSNKGYLGLNFLTSEELKKEGPALFAKLANYYVMTGGPSYAEVVSLPGAEECLVRYSFSQEDRKNLSEGLVKLSQLLFAADAEKIFLGPSIKQQTYKRGEVLSSSFMLPRGKANLMSVHVFGSMCAGEAPHCFVDSYGRLKNHKDIFIQDASILGGAPGVNPQASIMAMVQRNIQQLMENRWK